MKRLVAALVSAALLLGGFVAASPATAASGWQYSHVDFTLHDYLDGRPGTLTVHTMRLTGSSANGYLLVSGEGYTCTTSAFSGMTANFFVASYNPCRGWVTFAVDASGTLTVSDSTIIMPKLYLAGSGQGSAAGSPYPPAVTCMATYAGSDSATITFSDPGTGATGYTATSTPALPATASQVSLANGMKVTGLTPGTSYTFTVTAVGGSAAPGVCAGTVDVPARPAPPTGSVQYGAITVDPNTNGQVREFTLVSPNPAPAGWTLDWVWADDGSPINPPHGVQTCGSTYNAIPRWVQGGASIAGSPVPMVADCGVPTATAIGGTISGTTVTVNYTLSSPATTGVEVWARYKVSGVSGAEATVRLGAPPAGGSSGTGTFTVPGLVVPQGAFVRLYATNGPARSATQRAQVAIPGELPVLADYPTTVTGVAGETATKTTASPVPVNFTAAGLALTSFGYSLATGSTLPAGLKVDARTGIVSGNGSPLAAGSGSAAIWLKAFDKRTSNVVTVKYDIAPAPPAPGKASYPDVSGVVGTRVDTRPTLGSGTTGYFSAKDLCTAFPGLSLDTATGRITGTPTAPATARTIDVAITDKPAASGCSAPTGAFVGRTMVRIEISAAPQSFSLTYAQSSITALVGSTLPPDTPTVLPPGQTGLTYAVTAGVLPSGVTLDGSTGVIGGGAGAKVTASTVTITATDAAKGRRASTDVTFTFLPVPSGTNAAIAYPDVPSAPIGVPLSVLPLGGVGGQSFALDVASVKAGLTIDAATGRISWTPAPGQLGVRTVTVTVTVGGTSAALAPFTITVTAPPATASPAGQATGTGTAGGSSGAAGSGASPNACLAPTGSIYADFHGSVGSTLTMAPNTLGMPLPSSFQVTGGTLPAGVSLDGTYGVISGTPERSNGGKGPVEITTTWPDGTQRVSDFSIAVDDPHHAINYPNRILGSVGQPVTITPLPINPQGPRRFTLVCGTLPAGTSLDARTGVISGTPTTSDERPIPLRVRMTDSYGWVDASLIFVVSANALAWIRYPEFAQIGTGRAVRIVPTTTGLVTGTRYRIVGKLPKGLKFNKANGIISGRSVVRNRIVYEPTVTAFTPAGQPQATTVPSVLVIKPAVPMRVTARTSSKALGLGSTIVVTKVKKPQYVRLTAKVSCSHCTFTFNARTGRLTVKLSKGSHTVTAHIVGQPTTAPTRAAYAGHTWTRSWRVRH